MSIWGRRNSDPAAEQSQTGTNDAQEPAAGHQDGEPAPAFWRAQGQAQEQAPAGRPPADAPPPAYGHVPENPPPAGVPLAATMEPAPAYGQSAAAQAPPAGSAPAPATGQAPAGAEAPGPVLTGVVVDEETAVKDSAQTGAQQPAQHEDQATHDAAAGGPAATEVQEPTVAVAREPAPTGVGESALAASAITPQRWSEILAAFVDDPRGAVQMAADAVDGAIDEFVNSVRARQRDLASSWQGGEAGTEELRTALREYRKLGQRVQQLDLGGRPGG